LNVNRTQKLSKIDTWGRGDSNPYAFRHMILSHARLPIPTLPRKAISSVNTLPENLNQKVNQ
jgi:hypothetical protein